MKTLAVVVVIVSISFLGQVIAYPCDGCECLVLSDMITATCSGDKITEVPQDLPVNISSLYIYNTKIKVIDKSSLSTYGGLAHIYIERNKFLTTLEKQIFSFNIHLSRIRISDNPALTNIDKSTFDGYYRGIRSIDLSNNLLQTIPDLSQVGIVSSTLPYHLDLSGNPMTSPTPLCGEKAQIEGVAICQFINVTIRNTQMKYLPSNILNGTEIRVLDLANNPELSGFDDDFLSYLAPNILQTLILSNNPKLKTLPSLGVSSIEVLKCENCHQVKRIPLTISYQAIQRVYLTYPQHCCAFKNPEIQDRESYEKKIKEQEALRCKSTTDSPTTTTPSDFFDIFSALPGSTTSDTNYYSTFRKLLQDFDSDELDFYSSSDDEVTPPMFINVTIDPSINHHISYDKNCTDKNFDDLRDLFKERSRIFVNKQINIRKNLVCVPGENAFTPCGDIFEEKHWLRVILWFVAISAILGNFIVLAFTIFSRTKSPMTVTKFLICNLAFSDALQGTYLLSLAVVDLKTFGEYFNYATWWQFEGGCDIVGFITIFASELSVYTLSVITLERWYAISHAIHLTKRVQMKHAVVIMLFGWIFSASMAMMPLFDFSSYELTSLCLPFKFETARDQGYIYVLLGLNMAAFVVVLLCYVSIFYQVRGSNASMASDTNLARRMALLVFTDFVCWGPVAIVAGLTAGGVNIQDSLLTDENSLFIAKVVLVIFYPFNACANPFLYAIITKQFRKDCLLTLNYCGLYKRKMSGPRPRQLQEDSVLSNRHNNIRNSQSHMSNSTQLTTTASHNEHNRGGSIKSKSSIEALITQSLNCTIHPDMRRHSSISVRDYALKVISNKSTTAHTHNSKRKRHSISEVNQPAYTTSISCSASTIDSIESRRPSEMVRVPETLEEINSISYDDQLRENRRHLHTSLPWDNIHTREQWHRDRWLSDERNNKSYSDKSTDIDSGTDTNHISESECEDYTRHHHHQSSVDSSCSTGVNLDSRRQNHLTMGRASDAPSFDMDSESDCECLNHFDHSKNIYKSRSKSENNNIFSHEIHVDSPRTWAIRKGKQLYSEEGEELLRIQVADVSNLTEEG